MRQTQIKCRQTRRHLNFSGLSLCFISFTQSRCLRAIFKPVEPLSPDTLILPLNDFSSSDASHLIKVESLMPFRDPSALDRIHCHYGNEWRQLRTQMFSHIMTESLLMCLVIFAVAASDWRPLVGDSANHVTRLAAPRSGCVSARRVPLSPALRLASTCCSSRSLVLAEKSADRREI